MRATRHRPAWLIGPFTIAVMTALAMSNAGAADPVPGGQGVVTSLPVTASQVVVTGRDQFAGLEITVNQTESLVNQAVSITWTGGAPTVTSPGTFSGNFLQIMQCWGDDDGSVPGNPGPPPEQCVQGAIASTTAAPSTIYPDPYAVSRIIGLAGWPNLDPNVGVLDPRSSFVWRPFRAVDGTVIEVQTDPTFLPGTTGGNAWLNTYFNSVTTNEIAGARTNSSGQGAELFEVHTGLQSSGLGCGQTVEPTPTGNKVPQCWIVIVPRGDALVENAGTPFDTGASGRPVSTSPLRPEAWMNRIAIPIDFIPVDSPCSLADEERRLVGSDLIQMALLSWQPALCTGGTLPPYSFAPVSDAAARQQLALSAPGGPGMVVVSRPLTGTALDPHSPAVYAPVSVSGLAVGFNIERNPKSGSAAEAELAGVRVADLNLTPRLVAKLLTQSYQQQVKIGGVVPASHAWVTNNPASMGSDPDFLQFNPEFHLLITSDDRTFGGLQLPSGTSDSALLLWEWVLADPEAVAWLNGQADQWGMNVNPVYSTDAQLNPTGFAFGSPIPTTFPKADPYCFEGLPRGQDGSIVPPPLCGTDWMPYSRNFAETARVARTAFDGARIVENAAPTSSSDVWARTTPQYIGKRMMLSLTDTPSAARFGLQLARLSRAGDNGTDRQFVAADDASLLAGVASMAPGLEPTVVEPASTVSAPGAYPLTAVTYAAIKPLSLDAAARTEYAAFLEYAAGPGQVIGAELGQLPKGYAALPDTMQAQTIAAATTVRTMVAEPPPPAPTTTTVPTMPEQLPVTSAEPTQPDTNVAVQTRTTRSNPTTAPTNAAPPNTEPVTTEAPTTTEAPVTTEPPVTTEAPVDPADEPVPSGPAVVTPIIDLARSRYAVSGLGVLALGSALGALEITKRARKAPADSELDSAFLEDDWS